MIRFTVVIPTCDRPELLAECLRRLAPGAQTLATGEYEVVVTDDGAAASAAALVAREFSWARWTRGPRRGPAANRNHGARQATGTWLAFTDDDCQPERGWLAGFDSALARQPEAEVLEGRTYADRPRQHPLEFSPINEHGGLLWSCNLALRRDRFVALGGFDERFPYNAMEDIELRTRLRQQGVPCAFAPAAAVCHPWRRISDWRRHCRRHMKSRLILEGIHPGAGFPASRPRLLLIRLRQAVQGGLPMLLQHPGATLPHLPVLVRMLAFELILSWKRPPESAFNP